MRWKWDPRKDAENRRKHGVGFDTAQLVFADPLALSVPDSDPDEERWLVVHTWPVPDVSGEEVGRIISARKAKPHERRRYENGEF